VFTPRAKLESAHSLISNHMKAHYKRIASVQGAVTQLYNSLIRKLTGNISFIHV